MFPLHLVSDYVDSISLATLPAIHALTGCDTTSKVGMKLAFLKKPLDLSILEEFGVSANNFTEDVLGLAEQFLISVCKPKSSAKTFDDLRFEQYHDSKVLDFWKLVCTSDSIKGHISRAFLQALRWYSSHDPPKENLPNPIDFGYKLNENDQLVPVWMNQSCRPRDLPDICTCKVCHSEHICGCRKLNIACSRFCVCKANSNCQNPCNSN